ncbi:MAG TPA: hypothetical protein VMW41_02655 [Candidatus Bathyarchaeia archaeon]|nr:hypothetical protein [Candidatus Bathyarchaeia archaeon]
MSRKKHQLSAGKIGLFDPYFIGVILFAFFLTLGHMYFTVLRPRNEAKSSSIFTPTPTLTQTAKKRVCPEAWYIDKMPGPAEETPPVSREYLVIDGQRVEARDYDLAWIRANCSVKQPAVVW